MSEQIFKQPNDEPMRAASIQAIRTFKYYWRELSWESRRIIPGLDMNAVKVPIKTDSAGSNVPPFEHMWFENIEYDGVEMSGDLLNEPSWVSGMKQGDRVKFKLEGISDWMYASNGRVYGGFTVNVMRRSMNAAERKQHDAAWGLDFGDPNKVYIVPKEKSKGGIFSWGSKVEGYVDGDCIPEHPMSLNMAGKCEDGIRENPKPFIDPNEDGSTMLHFDALAGNLTQVKILLKYGANPKQKNRSGKTARDLALILKWDEIVKVL